MLFQNLTRLLDEISDCIELAKTYLSGPNQGSDTYNGAAEILSEFQRIGRAIQEYKNSPECIEEVRSIIEAFWGQISSSSTIDRLLAFARPSGGRLEGCDSLYWPLSILSLFRTKLRALCDGSIRILSLTERSLIHLNRLIVVDAEQRKKWITAFKKGEAECEKLGAIHLLWHGIWAFKAHSEKERTDLITNERLSASDAYKTAEGLVLTEWKKVSDPQKVDAIFNDAVKQAMVYSSSSVSFPNIELQSTRFIVLVSEDRLENLPSRYSENAVEYYPINIAVNPAVPSKRTKRATKKKKAKND
jgi:hypothetical protein